MRKHRDYEDEGFDNEGFEDEGFEDEGFEVASSYPGWQLDPFLRWLRKWWIVLAALLALIVVLALAVVYFCVHVWTDGSCTEDIACKICGKVYQTAPGHQWAEATCTDPRICRNCGIQGGEPLGHEWMEATYQRVETCRNCGATRGRPLSYMLTWCQVLEDSNESNSNSDVQRGSFTDADGRVYSDALRFWVADFGDWANTEYIVYELGADYELMEFSIAADKDNHELGETKIRIYGDGQLLYESPWIGNNSGLTFASVNVQGVKNLRIECTTDSNEHCYCIVEAELYEVDDIS